MNRKWSTINKPQMLLHNMPKEEAISCLLPNGHMVQIGNHEDADACLRKYEKLIQKCNILFFTSYKWQFFTLLF